jgi:hypothetical protein
MPTLTRCLVLPLLALLWAAVPPEDKEQFQKLTKVLQGQLSGVKVYKVGDEAQKQGDIGGRTTER